MHLVPKALAQVHPRYGTPARALLWAGLPLAAGGIVVVQRNLSIHQIFGLFGGFTELGFLLVYGLVALSSLRVALPGNTRVRQRLVGRSALIAVSAMAVAYLSGAMGQQNTMLFTFAALLLLGAFRACWVLPLGADPLR